MYLISLFMSCACHARSCSPHPRSPLQNFISLYADDTKLYNYILNHKSAETVQEDLNKLAEWSSKMQMSFNPEKCHRMHLGSNHSKFKYFLPKVNATFQNSTSTCYTLYCHNLEEVDAEKDLGVMMDSKLNFKKHISQKIAY